MKTFRTYITENVKSVTNKYKGTDIDVYVTETDDDITLHSIIIPKDKRKSGIGTSIMDDLVQYADKTNKRILLTPGSKDDNHGTTSKSRLVKFYKRFGFVENKGRNKNYRINAGVMYRRPE